MGGKPVDLLICNSGLAEPGYRLGRALREIAGETRAMRLARVRSPFTDHLSESKAVVDIKIDGYIAMTHLWVAEAVYANTPLQVVYISSRQAIDPGPGVPGYCVANWAVLALPKVLRVNLGRNAPRCPCPDSGPGTPTRGRHTEHLVRIDILLGGSAGAPTGFCGWPYPAVRCCALCGCVGQGDSL